MDALGIDPKLLIAQVINFAIFFLIFKKFIAAPLTRYLAKKKSDEESIAIKKSEIDTSHAEIEKMRHEALAQVKEDQKRLMKEMKEQVAVMKKQMLDEATAEAAKIVEDSRSALEHEKTRAQAAMAKQVQALAEAAVTQGLKAYMTEDQRATATNLIINNLTK